MINDQGTKGKGMTSQALSNVRAKAGILRRELAGNRGKSGVLSGKGGDSRVKMRGNAEGRFGQDEQDLR